MASPVLLRRWGRRQWIVGGRQWPAHGFKRLALGGDAPARGDEAGADHQKRPEKITSKDTHSRAGIDQAAEKPGIEDTADAGPDRVEERDRQGADLERKWFADRQIGRTRRRRGEEEDNHPADGQGCYRYEILGGE